MMISFSAMKPPNLSDARSPARRFRFLFAAS